MSDDNKDPSQDRPTMDYDEHERTFSMFLLLAKWGTIGVAALLIALAFGFLVGAGFVGGTILFILMLVVAAYLA